MMRPIAIQSTAICWHPETARVFWWDLYPRNENRHLTTWSWRSRLASSLYFPLRSSLAKETKGRGQQSGLCFLPTRKHVSAVLFGTPSNRILASALTYCVLGSLMAMTIVSACIVAIYGVGYLHAVPFGY
ncbi:hypothetical protein JAAARDRAFT_323750 [Jaapia argillacea MUCL 33604]|uniref:Uncharacterized protein n=1 Tax=Jaapia argillacea MUCL 33604 TaxID=933084 RepID=A0A067PLB5_9AGAM|nr:hypothetical protein JAAARDRAFT_323750 [Jaapia argillacea MUCL 33604]